MADEIKSQQAPVENKSRVNATPLVFISHDSRDADLAEALSKLLRSVSAGMLKSFRSSDKKGSEGIEFGDEWYKRLMEKLDSASDVVCLLTERSLERPWILYEAGVAKGKLETPVVGIALGIPLASANAGPFYQFQNSDDAEDSLTKLVLQLVRRVPGLEPDQDVVKAQVKAFKSQVDELLAKLKKPGPSKKEEPPPEPATAKVLEELKVIVRDLPTRMRRSDEEFDGRRSRRFRRYHPMIFREMMHMIPDGREGPLAILIAASFVREDFPWIYELAREAYEAIQTKSKTRRENALCALRRAIEFSFHGPFPEEMMMDKESHMMLRDVGHQIGALVERHVHEAKPE